MAKRRTVKCGRCSEQFPVGSAHNARTCGKQNPKRVTRVPRSGVQQSQNYKTLNPQKKGKVVSVQEAFDAAPGLRVEHATLKTEQSTVQNEGAKNGEPEIWLNENGELHRTDGVAVLRPDGTQEWWVNGERHRVDGPAVVRADGTQEWWVNGQRHRVDGPAVKYADEGESWWVNGQRHRVGGPAVTSTDEFYEAWWVNGERHRVDGPAETHWDGTMKWYLNGKLHRTDGPAVKSSYEGKVWYVNDVRSDFPDLCEKATRTGLTDDEFYELCNHKDYVVRCLAVINPECSQEWRTLAELKN